MLHNISYFANSLILCLYVIAKLIGDIFNPIGIHWYNYEMLSKYGKIQQYFCIIVFPKVLKNGMHPFNLKLIIPDI